MPSLPRFAECRWDDTPLAQGWPSLGVQHYESDAAYDSWQGRTLTPHNRHALAPKYNDLKDAHDPGLRYKLCRLPQSDMRQTAAQSFRCRLPLPRTGLR